MSQLKRPFGNHIEFFRQFRQRFETTGAVAPSSRFLASEMTRPMRDRSGPIRVLEIGPGTGAVTEQIVRHLRPQDCFDLVELNESFVEILNDRFAREGRFCDVASLSKIHACKLQDFEAEAPYDFVVSGLPLNNFPAGLVREIFEIYFELLAPGGVLSYFEYMYVRPIRRLVSKPPEKQRLGELGTIMEEYIASHRFRRSWVFINVPPAWVQHLRKPQLALEQKPVGV